MEKKIDLTHIAIRHYDATINAMRTAILRKTFPGVKFKECVKLIKDLQSMSLEDFKKQIGKDKQFLNVEKEEIWLPDLIQCLRNMDAIQDYKSEEEIMLIYNLVHSFSIKEEVFITPIHN
ncbi:hypothetical protein KKG31_05480 [Patescibacteria group bacterium]|nr:hypothetical protein [Patescibacteria group bacterium]MBU1758560.1 hypothetical protein [Patescibacteria group bacterium]